MKNFSISILCTLCLTGNLCQQADAQSAAQRRFSENSFRRHLRIDKDSPLFVSDAEAKDYFDYKGEWKLETGGGISYDTNAYQDATKLEDWSCSYGASLAYEWWVSEASGLVITPELAAAGTRFDRFSDLDGDQLAAGLAFTFRKLPVETTLRYGAGWGFTRGYDDRNYSEHNLSVEFGSSYFLHQTAEGSDDEDGPAVAWKLIGGCLLTDPDADSAFYTGFSLQSSLPLTERLSLELSAAAGYRDYTESSALGRDTWTFDAEAVMEWPISEKWALSAGLLYTHASDRLPDFDYDRVVASIGLKFAWEGFRLLGLPDEKLQIR